MFLICIEFSYLFRPQSGHDAVTWMVKSGRAAGRDAAVDLGRLMLLGNIVRPVTDDDDEFHDKQNRLYRYVYGGFIYIYIYISLGSLEYSGRPCRHRI